MASLTDAVKNLVSSSPAPAAEDSASAQTAPQDPQYSHSRVKQYIGELVLPLGLH